MPRKKPASAADRGSAVRAFSTDIAVIGAGAAGLMAGATAGETSLRVVCLERRHRPGLKLRLCGNNRCNITHQGSAEDMLGAYAPPHADFLARAVRAFPPGLFRQWLAGHGLATTVHADGRVFPASEKADDVVHFFTDRLRDLAVPLMVNAAVTSVERTDGGFTVRTQRADLTARVVLLCTGGVSYPKTGSVGDGQTFAKALGHAIVPYRPGLAGLELSEAWLHAHPGCSIADARVTLGSGADRIGETRGEILCDRRCARGPAMVNASSVMAHAGVRSATLRIDLVPDRDLDTLARELSAALRGGVQPESVVADLMAHELVEPFCRHVWPGGRPDGPSLARGLKDWCLEAVRVRPLKEAMVTVGGVTLDEIDPSTMESRRVPGLFFAGEIMDVDGPTGGYNLHAAFATARLAMAECCRRAGVPFPAMPPPGRRRRGRSRGRKGRRQQSRRSRRTGGRRR